MWIGEMERSGRVEEGMGKGNKQIEVGPKGLRHCRKVCREAAGCCRGDGEGSAQGSVGG